MTWMDLPGTSKVYINTYKLVLNLGENRKKERKKETSQCHVLETETRGVAEEGFRMFGNNRMDEDE